jgi:hypothetical protein
MTEPIQAPNFIVIGPGKSGTSWLYNVLGQHPEVCMSSAKETLYFEDYYHKGPGWYGRFFRKCSGDQQPRAVGEISNTYIFSPLAAERIAADFPHMKLIATLRDPTERAFSHYLFLRRNGGMQCTFEEALQRRPDLKTRGNYFEHLQPYRQRFPQEQLLILFFDDLKRDVEGYAARLFEYLNIGPLLEPTVLYERVLEASEPRSRWLAQCVVFAAQGVRRLGFPDVVTRFKQGLLPKLLFGKMKDGKKPSMLPETEHELRTYYDADLLRLSDWLGRDLHTAWGSPSMALAMQSSFATTGGQLSVGRTTDAS